MSKRSTALYKKSGQGLLLFFGVNFFINHYYNMNVQITRLPTRGG